MMPDPRFFEALGPVALGELAALAGASLTDSAGAAAPIAVAAPLVRAGEGAVSFLADHRYLSDLRATTARACFLRASDAGAAPPGCFILVTAEPQMAYVAAARRLHRPRSLVMAQQAIDPSATIEAGAFIATGAVIGPEARIGKGTVVGPNAVIGTGVCVGRDCVIGAGAVIGFALIGDRVQILAGAVIGEAGFGVAGGAKGAVDIPQLGRVILQDGVTVGANSCIDRGAWDDTVVGENTKIDNLVQVGHNVRLGRNCALAAHTGISGSVVAGDGVQYGGRVGVADHITIGAGAQLMASAGVMRDVPAGETWGGFPAAPARQWLRQAAYLGRISRSGQKVKTEQDEV